MIDESLQDTSLGDALEAFNERMEYELRGAWRAGYDYVHVFDSRPEPMSIQDARDFESLTLEKYIYPSDLRQPPRPDSLTYEHTYDLTAVPDDVIRRHIRGE